ncbi:aminodeoxychorismate/anthranilate synthase component II [Aliidongia dinghuensis]|uniref:Aminodeoxychorismate/anthranilate synthase component II n=1 Tax=Aliidongia dinghuensis TaxID=1867774 RepID=A0A8J2YYL1_9PROT|nr:aminodeoxychorismate/anthranilate synthase component II [Aliidongia dinghuensis]GGF40278.1 aminodeoxychorismate/anthranilate synthase component II [Aliidongia dinghuensis]
MFLLIDNYDSFTYNLWHYLSELGAEIKVVRNDALTVEQALALKPQGLIISPGPGTPIQSGITVPIVEAAGALPVLGVCLGHQAIGEAFGGRVVRAPEPMHGKLSPVTHDGSGLFLGLPNPITVTRYHSLIVERSSLPATLRITAETADGLIMGLEHVERPIHGVQFHPESIASEAGKPLLANFLALATGRKIAA